MRGELEDLGHTAHNVLNIRHRLTKAALPLYFVDLEPRDNNKSIYDLQFLCKMKITVEAPWRKISIVQCTRCQSYGHTKTYYTRPFACVKRGRDHNRAESTKDPATPATCALCGGDHPATIKDVMSTAVFRQIGALPAPVRDPLLLVFPLHTSTIATLGAFLPYPTLNPLYHSPNPILIRIPMPSPTVPSLLISGHKFPLFSPSSRCCLTN